MNATASPRPIGLALAVALLGIIALAGLVFGPYLVVLGVLVGNDVGGDAGRVVLTLELMLGIGSGIVAVVSALSARGLWRGAGWAWPAALFVGIALVVVTIVLALEDRWLPSFALIGLVGASLVVALLPASVRRAFGV